ncbi:hypothetical protein QYF36_000804 [Acer negundo]|nr:hypothetical protein QYF36_000804 [Acer negundo]
MGVCKWALATYWAFIGLELNSQEAAQRRIQFSKHLRALALLDLVPSGDRLASNNKLFAFLQLFSSEILAWCC